MEGDSRNNGSRKHRKSNQRARRNQYQLQSQEIHELRERLYALHMERYNLRWIIYMNHYLYGALLADYRLLCRCMANARAPSTAEPLEDQAMEDETSSWLALDLHDPARQAPSPPSSSSCSSPAL